jgi:hypothetical protein
LIGVDGFGARKGRWWQRLLAWQEAPSGCSRTEVQAVVRALEQVGIPVTVVDRQRGEMVAVDNLVPQQENQHSLQKIGA